MPNHQALKELADELTMDDIDAIEAEVFKLSPNEINVPYVKAEAAIQGTSALPEWMNVMNADPDVWARRMDFQYDQELIAAQ